MSNGLLLKPITASSLPYGRVIIGASPAALGRLFLYENSYQYAIIL